MNPAHLLVASMAEKLTLPEVYHRIRGLIRKPDAKIDEYAEVIATDPALSARTMKIANNPFFGYSRKAYTVPQAISLIGVMQLHDLLLSSLAIRAFSGIPIDVIDQRAFWRGGVYCGIAARLLARKCSLPASARLFTSGLLHEIGHIVMYTKIPDQVHEAFLESRHLGKPLHLVQREKLGFDYGQVGRELMAFWRLPENYQNINAFHMDARNAKVHGPEVAIVNLARSMMLAEENAPESSGQAFLKPGHQILLNKLNEEHVETIQANARSHVADVMDCLRPSTAERKQDFTNSF